MGTQADITQALDAARSNSHQAKVAKHYDKVWKDECMLCFCTPQSQDGMYVNLNTFQGFCRDHISFDQQRNGGVLYLHMKSIKVPQAEGTTEQPAAVPDKLAIGVPGGFATDDKKEQLETNYSLAVLPQGTLVPLPCPELPEQVLDSITSVQTHDSAATQAQAETWQEEPAVSKYAADLEQLPCHRKVPMDPSQWKCDETGVTENLWLNLSTGFIGSGRPHWDGTGGNGSALRHYEQTGNKYPLAVKLGTITPAGADVYSYAADEDDMVLDPLLPQHLAHWGINVLQMEKTEKTMAELQVEKNMEFEFDKITEAGAELQPVSGKGFVGLKNLGNSCYVNSVLQLLWTLPQLQERYARAADKIFESAPSDLAQDFITQFAKVGVALAGEPHKSGACQNGNDTALQVTPVAFKTLVGKGHPEFSSNRQQDAHEYFSHLMELVGRSEHSAGSRLAGGAASTKLFEFGIETRVECLTSHRVSYKTENQNVLSLEIPVEAAINSAEVADYEEREQKRQKLKTEEGEEKVLPRVPLDACLMKFGADEVVDGYFSAFLKQTTQAKKTTRLASFPEYLVVHLRRYFVAEDWTPKKLEVLVDMPERLSLGGLRGVGQQAGEELQPDAQPESEQPNESLVAQLLAMGFPEERCKRAALSSGNADVEAAMEWLLTHEDDAIAPPPSSQSGNISAEALSSLEGMGFNAQQATAALSACQGNVERAVEWLFSRMDQLESVGLENTEAEPVAEPGVSGGGNQSGTYELVGFISHIGKNTACGHYVCHIKKDGRWTIFNDEKVAVSEHPPLQLGYMYLYKQLSE